MNLDTNTALNTARGESPDVVAPPTSIARKTDSRNDRGVWQEHGYWAASAGRDPETKKRLREYGFKTKEEAIEWRLNTLAGATKVREERHRKARSLIEAEAFDAAVALDILYRAGFTGQGLLKIAVDEFIARHPEAVPTTVAGFYPTWLKCKSDRDRRNVTLRSAKSTLASFLRKHGQCPLAAIKLAHIEEFVFDPAIPNPTTRRGRGVVVTNFFNEAQKRGLIGDQPKDHPCFALVLPAKPEGEPEPWPLVDFETLLRFAWEHEDIYHCTAFILLGAYAGLRTEELLKIRFSSTQIDIDGGTITVNSATAKKRRKRTFDMEPTLQLALKAIRDRKRIRPKFWRKLPRPTDPDSKAVSPKLLRDFRGALKLAPAEGGAGLPIVDEGGRTHKSKTGKVTLTEPSAWRPNGLRAAFATYHFERDPARDARVTAGIMGHTGDLTVFFNHYRTLAQKGEGAAFFAIASKVLGLVPLA